MNCNRDEAGKVLVRSMKLPEYALTNLSDICDSEEAVHIGCLWALRHHDLSGRSSHPDSFTEREEGENEIRT